ncbi:Uncharacterised protein [Vibrio cholerae]|nr:Uncharacterised protein [Vibrio cholerae]
MWWGHGLHVIACSVWSVDNLVIRLMLRRFITALTVKPWI